jgi:outer membrane autotransporter protein
LDFFVPLGPNTVLTDSSQVMAIQKIIFQGGVLEAAANLTLNNDVHLNQNGTFLADAGTSSALGGVISGPGSFFKTGPGALTLTGVNTFAGDTIIEEGPLYVNGSVASANTFVGVSGLLGGTGTMLGNVSSHGIVSPGHSPGTFHINGDFTQYRDGALRIEIGGRKAGQFDRLEVGGRANLDGILELVGLNNFRLKRGDRITFLTAQGGVDGQFALVVNPFTSETILQPTAVYGEHSVALEMVQGSFAEFAENWALSPNQRAVGRALDSAVFDKKADKLIAYLDERKLEKLPGDFNKIAPEELTSIFTIGTSLAQVQSQNIQRRADDIRAGASGFSAQRFSMTGGQPSYSGGFGIASGVAGPMGNDGKESKAVFIPTPDKRWGAFLSGSGEWVSVGDTDNARGYDVTSGGFTLGVDYKVCPNFAVGVMAGYTGTDADLTNGGDVRINGGKLGLYATTFVGGWYADVAVTGGYNSYDTKRHALQGTARGSTDGGELNVLVGTGYDWKIGALSIGPTATFNYTLVGLDGFTERGSLAPLNIASRNAESVRTTVGFKTSYDWKIGGVLVRPELRAAWQHEYGDSSYGLEASFANGAGDSFLVSGPQLGRDSLLLGAGFAVQFTETCSTYLYYDGELGRERYDRHSVSGGVRVAF